MVCVSILSVFPSVSSIELPPTPPSPPLPFPRLSSPLATQCPADVLLPTSPLSPRSLASPPLRARIALLAFPMPCPGIASHRRISTSAFRTPVQSPSSPARHRLPPLTQTSLSNSISLHHGSPPHLAFTFKCSHACLPLRQLTFAPEPLHSPLTCPSLRFALVAHRHSMIE